eukprot:14062410-Alexandrium_andersonii.AAC.1
MLAALLGPYFPCGLRGGVLAYRADPLAYMARSLFLAISVQFEMQRVIGGGRAKCAAQCEGKCRTRRCDKRGWVLISPKTR